MRRFVLITVDISNREIIEKSYDSLDSAREQMKKEVLGSPCECCEISTDCAWSNLADGSFKNWKIIAV